METEAHDIEHPPVKKQKLDSKPTDTEPKEIDFTQDVTVTKSSIINDNYNDFVTPEELEKLKEFKVLDETGSNDEDSHDDDSDSSEGKPIDDEEIEKMLEENLPDDFKGAPKPKERPYVTVSKTVLEEKGGNHFEMLPLDWMMIQHYSGMPLYMHRTTRVCTLSKPYFLGKGNARRHDIPLSAIPCLAYKRALEEEVKQKEIDRRIEEQVRKQQQNLELNKSVNEKANNEAVNIVKANNPNRLSKSAVYDRLLMGNVKGNKTTYWKDYKSKCPYVQHKEKAGKQSDYVRRDIKVCDSNRDKVQKSDSIEKKDILVKDFKTTLNTRGIVMAPPRVETVSTSLKTQHLTAEQVNDYCKKLFKFKVLRIMHFKRWADRRKYNKARKTFQHPALAEGTKLITIPMQRNSQENGGKGSRRDWVMSMNGCSYLSVFHEYVGRALKKQPVYEFKQLENASMPYQATVYIGGMQYGVGYGTSKRQAKAAAARSSVHILIPEMKDELDAYDGGKPTTAAASANAQDADFSFFDYVGIEDPRITDFCAATCEPSPHAILRTCLLRNFGTGERHIHVEMKKLEYQEIELTMKVGKHTATVVCKNKRIAKQRASQAILQALHPHVRSWGSLLRLYGSKSVKSCKEKKQEEQQITLLQDKARHNEPNYAVLEKLRSEMLKLKDRDAAFVPIGTFTLTDSLPTHSNSDLNNVELL
ncbi:hypothetical protein K1T71_011059 [Dendrolimus kikuchii]|uniref:Uncharacterized protein n=1 Tax=Dendrolimus kikuchii TaxID=765133 RepID=A0ACC1CMS3_9NEOP|nr:hypothetical protein K1T71_011059 [Dendrolimus kikuchii]